MFGIIFRDKEVINFNQITRIQMSFSHQQNSNNTKQKSFEQSLNSTKR